jgi:hypothetical protein
MSRKRIQEQDEERAALEGYLQHTRDFAAKVQESASRISRLHRRITRQHLRHSEA